MGMQVNGSGYAETFNQRGHPYEQAMIRFPDARKREFQRLLDHVVLNPRPVVLDIPSGGGYLSRFLPASSRLVSVDPSDPFQCADGVNSVDLENLSLPKSRYDFVVSLAALHHVKNKKHFLQAVEKSLISGGYCCFADVATGSGISAFLDEFAGKYNGMGHAGAYLEVDSPFPGFHNDLGLTIRDHSVKACPWIFDSEDNMVKFCRLLFGLFDVKDDFIREALGDYIGFNHVDQENNKRVHLNWELLYITLHKHQA
ncbi:hypothetical protein CI610_00385 [invertebrate metagenome]|uniref:Uncharacterized protein n=1 Tax=invertebrate metagenome TaxID=1711999 RepID=A0A2H9TBM3_9ZZZZ